MIGLLRNKHQSIEALKANKIQTARNPHTTHTNHGDNMNRDEVREYLIDLLRHDPEVIGAFFDGVESFFATMRPEQKVGFFKMMLPSIPWDMLPAIDEVDWAKIVGMLPRKNIVRKSESFLTRLDRMTGLKK